MQRLEHAAPALSVRQHTDPESFDVLMLTCRFRFILMFMLTLRFRFVQVRPPVQRSTGPRVRDKSSAAAILIASDVSAGRSGAGND
jgi:hypothetical protein